MTPEELKDKITNKSNIQIIDLREEYEFEDGSICNTNIPMGEVMTRLNEINNEGEVVMFCKSLNQWYLCYKKNMDFLTFNN